MVPESVVACSEKVGERVYSCKDGGRESSAPMLRFVATKPEIQEPEGVFF
jgi:hypothetical protein